MRKPPVRTRPPDPECAAAGRTAVSLTMTTAFGVSGTLPARLRASGSFCRSPTVRQARAPAKRRRARALVALSSPGSSQNEMEEWYLAVEGLLAEALMSYYEDAPLFSDAEFNALRDEVEHLAAAQLRLGSMEKIWVQATSARDFDRRMQTELRMSEEEYRSLKRKLESSPGVRRPTRPPPPLTRPALPRLRKANVEGSVKDAETINSGTRVDARIRWLLFGDASVERLKVALLYFPAVLICLVATSLLTILFALLDGEMTIQVSQVGRARLGVLSYIVVMATAWFSNKVTPLMLDFLDLGQPTLLRGPCPNCGAPVSCLFTGTARARDERKCSVCGAIVGFNRKWSKVFLVAEPGDISYSQPD